MSMVEKIIEYLENAKKGDFIRNDETGIFVEVTNMCGGRYLVCDKYGEPIRQTDNEMIAYKYLR